MFQPAEVLELCKHKLHVNHAHLIILAYVKLRCSIKHTGINSTLHVTGCTFPCYVNINDVLRDKRMPSLFLSLVCMDLMVLLSECVL